MKIRLLAALAAVVMISACGHESGSGIAVLDLDAIASATGQDEEIARRAQAGSDELAAQLEALVAQLDKEIEEKRAELGPGATEEQLAEISAAAQQQFTDSQNFARQQATQLRNNLIQQFIDQVRPIAAEIAERKGASAILTESPALFWHDADMDLTDEVIAEVRARGISLDSLLDDDDEIDVPVQ